MEIQQTFHIVNKNEIEFSFFLTRNQSCHHLSDQKLYIFLPKPKLIQNFIRITKESLDSKNIKNIENTNVHAFSQGTIVKVVFQCAIFQLSDNFI